MKKVQKSINDLKTMFPTIAEEWDSEKNMPYSASDFASKSHKKVWWRCKEGHSWEAIISNRTQHNRGCPYCAHQLPIVGETDFAAVCPEVAKEWHPTRNGKIKPSDVMPGTHKKVWWKCNQCGYEWQSEVKSRTIGSSNCPICNRSKKIPPLVGINDIVTKSPEIIKYWHPTKNLPLTLEDYTYGSGKKVWWKCKNGHEYQMSVASKSKGAGCPICNKRRRTSFPEQAIYYYVKKSFPNAINNYKAIFKGSMELDVFIPEINVGIEYDGKVFHESKGNKQRDYKKYQICRKNEIRLIRIANTDDETITSRCDYYIKIATEKNSEIQEAIIRLFEYLHTVVDVNIKRDRFEILQYLEALDVSLATEYPDIAKEFDEAKNGQLKAEYFHPGSNERVWWKCSTCGHSWYAQIRMRTIDGNGCPKCAKIRGAERKKVYHLKKNGSIEETHPELLQFWNYKKNKMLPSEIIAGTSRKIWWKCEKGHEWESSADHASHRGLRCPYCSNKRILTGFNDLATIHPELLEEWNFKRNIKISPYNVGAGTAKKAWWRCKECGYEWETQINLRSKGHGCPKCDNQRKIGNKYARKIRGKERIK